MADSLIVIATYYDILRNFMTLPPSFTHSAYEEFVRTMTIIFGYIVRTHSLKGQTGSHSRPLHRGPWNGDSIATQIKQIETNIIPGSTSIKKR